MQLYRAHIFQRYRVHCCTQICPASGCCTPKCVTGVARRRPAAMDRSEPFKITLPGLSIGDSRGKESCAQALSDMDSARHQVSIFPNEYLVRLRRRAIFDARPHWLLDPMSCEACQKLLIGDSDAPHDGLLAYRAPSILRPFGRPPVVLHRYRCKHCGFNWIRETDPLERERTEWICLYQASNILVPATADSHSLSSASEHSISSAPADRHPARPGNWLRRFS